MWIHVYPNWKANFNSKNGRKWSFSYETRASKSFTPIRRMCLWCWSWNEKRLLCEPMFIPTERQTSILKMVESDDFLVKLKHQNRYHNKENVFMCPIMKIKEITIYIHVYPNWKTNLNSKNCTKTIFSYETKAWKSFITARRMCL